MKINKIYQPNEFENKISKKWNQKKFFQTHDSSKRPFTVILPPPNVTGDLHIGHAINGYLPDSIIRYKKLNGYDVSFVPGMDHAGIATQSKVEDTIYKATGLNRHDFGREKFVEKIWEWKEKYASRFREQWELLGLGLDYQRERFTLDTKSNKAVNKAFIQMYKDGLIYRGNRAINWDPVLQTALSNIEVISEPTEQKMYYIKYPIKGTNEHLTIATVRTETLLSDVALIYNPKDQRYLKYKNNVVIHPLTKKELPIIADEYVDINFGTGLMKLSAHAEADIDIIAKYNLQVIETIDKNGYINAPESEFHKLERFQAREKIGEYLLANGYIEKIENTISNVGYSERSKAPVEILVMPQWFVKMDNLSQMVLDDLKTKQAVKFYPARFVNNLKRWMENCYDWTISRQLWWGHRIPAWYKENLIKVQESCPGEGWIQDGDVLDTWFSSALAPFSFLGWPLKNNLLDNYFPTSLLVTGYDIIFFWVARMYFFSLYFMKNKPFEHVLLTGLVRDPQGKKMSKSSGNGVIPGEIIKQYGSDALRWFLLTNVTPGIDIRYSEEKIKSAWALCNKLWNIARYINELPDQKQKSLTEADYWINNKLKVLKNKIDRAMKKYEFTVVGSEISKFVYEEFSSWYIEMLKIMPSKYGAMENLKKLLIIVHPFLPLVSDHLYKMIFKEELLNQKWPIIRLKNNENIDNIETIVKAVKILRAYREANNISKKETLYFDFNYDPNEFVIATIQKMANAEIKKNRDSLFVDGHLNIYIAQSEEQKQANKARVLEKISYLEAEIKRAKNMLNNPNFIAKAPANKVQEEQEKLEKFELELAKYQQEV